MKRERLRNRVMSSHDKWTSGTSRVLIVSLQRLKMEARTPAHAHCELRSVIKFLNAQRVTPIEIHHQLARFMGAHASTVNTYLV